jgi:uncharacterized protein
MKKKLLGVLSSLILVILLVFTVSGTDSNDTLRLLAVSELENGTLIGGIAYLTLELQPGTGNVFIDTYPLSKFDTQMSIRFAKEVACKFAAMDCSKYNFLYTIRADSEFIGGPSAGAAVSVITFAQLNQLPIDYDVAVTGTINSGRLIGNVGGIKEKIEGAASQGIKKVLIPIDEKTHKKENLTIDLVEYGSSLGIAVIPVSDLEDTLYHFLGINYTAQVLDIESDSDYQYIMEDISDSLCSRSDEIISLLYESGFNINDSDYTNKQIGQVYQSALDLINHSIQSLDTGSFYSAASQCFGANIKLYYLLLLSQDNSNEQYIERIKFLEDAIALTNENISKIQLSTITDLQTAMIVRQRTEESAEYLVRAKEYFLDVSLSGSDANASANATIDSLNISSQKSYLDDSAAKRDEAIYNLALAIERLRTTIYWSKFFQLEGQEYILNPLAIFQSCSTIIDDARSRIQYAQLYFPHSFAEQEKKIRDPKLKADPLFCIAQASTIKAEVNAIISSFGMQSESIGNLISRKLEKAKEVIAEEASSGRFPILGYSYYEYSNTLKDIDLSSSLLYAEYALELGNLDLYLDKIHADNNTSNERIFSITIPGEKDSTFFIRFREHLLMFVFVLIGFVIGLKLCQHHFKEYYVCERKTTTGQPTKKRPATKTKIISRKQSARNRK